MKKILMTAIAASLLSASSAFAVDMSADSFTFNTSLGLLSGEAKELVYNDAPRTKLSQLNWKFKNVSILKADLSWTPLPWLTASAKGWSNISSGNSHMQDFDWLEPGQAAYSDKSDHPDTRLKHANEYDLSLKGWLFRNDTSKFGVVAGYQQTRFGWDGYGGSYSYNNGADTGNFPGGEKGISYQQKLSLPYIGLAASYRYKDLEVNSTLKYSSWVSAQSRDDHIQRTLLFHDKQTSSNYYGAALDIGYYFLPATKVFTELAWNQYKEGRGDETAHDYTTGKHFYEPNSIGMSNTNYSVSLGLQYQF